MANNKQIQVYTPEIQEAFKPEVLEVIRTSLCPNATDPEFMLFAHKAASYRLDPFKNEIFFIKYGNQARIQFAAEAYLAKAREKEGFQPPDTQVVCANDEFKARKFKNEKGEDDWEVVQHEISFPRGAIVGAYSIAYRDGYRPVTEFVDKEHISHMYTGQNKDNWNKWEPDMIGKHAQQRALKRQYGLDLNDEEVPHGGPAEKVEAYERKDITPEIEQAKNTTDQTAPAPEAEQVKEDPMKQAKEEMKVKLKELGCITKDQIDEYLGKHANFKNAAKPTLAEMKGLLKIMDMHIEEKKEAKAAEDIDLLTPVGDPLQSE